MRNSPITEAPSPTNRNHPTKHSRETTDHDSVARRSSVVVLLLLFGPVISRVYALLAHLRSLDLDVWRWNEGFGTDVRRIYALLVHLRSFDLGVWLKLLSQGAATDRYGDGRNQRADKENVFGHCGCP